MKDENSHTKDLLIGILILIVVLLGVLVVLASYKLDPLSSNASMIAPAEHLFLPGNNDQCPAGWHYRTVTKPGNRNIIIAEGCFQP